MYLSLHFSAAIRTCYHELVKALSIRGFKIHSVVASAIAAMIMNIVAIQSTLLYEAMMAMGAIKISKIILNLYYANTLTLGALDTYGFLSIESKIAEVFKSMGTHNGSNTASKMQGKANHLIPQIRCFCVYDKDSINHELPMPLARQALA